MPSVVQAKAEIARSQPWAVPQDTRQQWRQMKKATDQRGLVLRAEEGPGPGGFEPSCLVLISLEAVPACCACPKSNSAGDPIHTAALHRSGGRGLHMYSSAKSLEASQAVPLVSYSDFPTLQNQKESGFPKLSTTQKVPD